MRAQTEQNLGNVERPHAAPGPLASSVLAQTIAIFLLWDNAFKRLFHAYKASISERSHRLPHQSGLSRATIGQKKNPETHQSLQTKNRGNRQKPGKAPQ